MRVNKQPFKFNRFKKNSGLNSGGQSKLDFLVSAVTETERPILVEAKTKAVSDICH